MFNSVGKKLQQARIGKQLSIEEAARVTRIRPDKLIDLEEDNYANFPSMSYAKGFLLLYARFLGVDVRDFAETLHSPNPVSSDDYEYLNAAAAGPPPPPGRRPYHFAPRRERTILPMIVFAFLAGVTVLVLYLVVSFQRLGSLDDIADKKYLSSPASAAISTLPAPPAEPAAAPVPGPIPVARAVATVVPVARPAPTVPVARVMITPVAPAPTVAPVLRNPPPVLVSGPPVAAPGIPPETPPPASASSSVPASATQPPAIPAGTFDPTREVRRAEAVLPAPDAGAGATPSPPAIAASGPISSIVPAESPGNLKQVVILPIRKTMVTVRKDMADSAPVFEDWLYPGDAPLKLTGHKFWIQVQDPGAVQISQDGQPLPAGQTDIQIE